MQPGFVQMNGMKYKAPLLIATAILVFVCVGATPASERSSVERTTAQDPVRTVRIALEGLRESRVDLANKTLRSVPGVLNVDFRTADREVVVTIDVDRTNLKRLDQSLRDAGFTPWIH